MAELVFFTGTMDCGKSTLALQTDHNHSARGRVGLILTSKDRAGEATLSSRLGLAVPAPRCRTTVTSGASSPIVAGRWQGRLRDRRRGAVLHRRARSSSWPAMVDELGIDVYAFGITTDFRTRLFPGSPAAGRAGRPRRAAAGARPCAGAGGEPRTTPAPSTGSWSSRASRSSSATSRAPPARSATRSSVASTTVAG